MTRFRDNPFHRVLDEPLSTFSIDVDTASYSNVRRFLNQYQWPPRDAVRIEELVNYFDYDYPSAASRDPFSVDLEQIACPWAPKHRLIRVALKGRELELDKRPAGNFVFLLDVSGSMAEPNKLPLVVSSMKMLVRQLTSADRIAIVVYAGASGVVLPTTRGDEREAILDALENLRAGGSTNGGAGIELAYKLASESFVKGGVNRVLLATDGDFNVGITARDGLIALIEKQAKNGVFLTVLGFGMGNYAERHQIRRSGSAISGVVSAGGLPRAGASRSADRSGYRPPSGVALTRLGEPRRDWCERNLACDENARPAGSSEAREPETRSACCTSVR